MAKKTKKINVIQDEEEEIPQEILAEAIVNISKAFKSLAKSGLNRRAIVALIHDNSRIAKRIIEMVLNNLEALKENYCN